MLQPLAIAASANPPSLGVRLLHPGDRDLVVAIRLDSNRFERLPRSAEHAGAKAASAPSR